MSVTQFAMVEELAFLVKDNLRSKHLVLSMEEAFINFLLRDQEEEDNPSSDGILELEPMDPYNRLLLHRLADIFGFAHVSIGEGDDRHLILQRCAETTIPSILVSDILFQYDEEPHSFTTPHELLRRDSSPVLKANSPSIRTIEERETAYLAARERIFSVDSDEMQESVRQRPKVVPVVARRMIAHALGKKDQSSQGLSVLDYKGDDCDKHDSVVQEDKGNLKSRRSSSLTIGLSPEREVKPTGKIKSNLNHDKFGASASSKSHNHLSKVPDGKSCREVGLSENGATGTSSKKEYSKEEHVGAARRMFANALGIQSAKGSSPAKMSKEKLAGTTE